MIRNFRKTLAISLISLSIGTAVMADVPAVMDPKDILPYLEKMISWRRAGAAIDVSPELPRALVIKNEYQQHARKVLDDSFTLARTLAEALPPEAQKAATSTEEPKTDTPGKPPGIRRAIAQAEQQISQLQDSLNKAGAAAARKKADGMLRLAEEHLSLLQAVAETIGLPNDDDDSLPKKITQLQGTVAELDEQQKQAENAATPAATPSSSSGIVGLATRIYGFVQTKSAVKALLNETRALHDENRDRSQFIRDSLKNILDQGNAIGAPKPAVKKAEAAAAKPDEKSGTVAAIKALAGAATGKTPQPAVLPAPPAPTYDSLVADMKKLSKIAIAMSQVNKSLTVTTHDLSNWLDVLNAHIKELFSGLVFRTSMLSLAIIVIYALSMIARKATRRYVTDRRRKDQLRIVRKVTTMIMVAVTLFLGFFTDLSSLATFAGLLTAGVAFATKDMILSLIAYFQFFGSSDIRVGDDVTVAGVTGKVTHISMLRFYLMETEKSDIGYMPTGRIVGFANSVLFNPTPLFRQTPGTNFVWNEIDMILSPTADHDETQKKLDAIVAKIYAKQREVIRKSEAALQKVSPLKLEISAPQTYFKFTNLGVVFAIRYAVEREQARSFHLVMMQELLAAIRRDPSLKVQHIAAPEEVSTTIPAVTTSV